MSLLWVADSFYVGVRDVAAATAWYREKFGLKETSLELGEVEGCVGLAFPKALPAPIILGPVTVSTDTTTRMLYTSDVTTARKWLITRGVEAGAIETDRQGTKYFSIRDLEGNPIEVSEEP